MAMDSFYNTYVQETYGDTAKKKQKAEFWKIVKLMLRVFLSESRKARVGSETPCNHIG